MKLYDSPFSPNCRKVRAVVHELGLQVDLVPVDLFNGENRAPSFVAVNPNACVPVLVDGDFVLWESNAIVAYLAHGTPLLPTDPRARAEVDRWNAWHLAHIGPAIWKVAFERYLKPRIGQGEADPVAVELGSADYRRYTNVLETSLGERAFVAGQLSIADFVLAPMYALASTVGLETAPFPKVDAWLRRMLGRPSLQRALADA
jgi:glutathione S-transferase